VLVAKLTQGYLNVSSGTCLEGLQVITGAPAENYKIEKENLATICKQFYNLLKIEKRIMTACTNQLVKEKSLEPCHAYSVLDIFGLEIVQRNGKPQLEVDMNWKGEYSSNPPVLVKLRNPWGSSDRYSGEWSFESKLWENNQELKMNLYGAKRDGTFFLSLQQFKEYFSEYDVAFYSPYNVHSDITLERDASSPFASVRMKITKAGKYYLMVTQPNPRMIPRENYEQQPPLKRISLLIVKVGQVGQVDQSPTIKYVKGLGKNRLSLYIDQQLEPGEYRLIISNLDIIGTATVSVYCPEKVSLKEEQIDQKHIVDLIRCGFADHSKNTPWLDQSQPLKHKHCLLTDGYGYFVILNDSDRTQAACIKLSEFLNLEFLDVKQPFKDSQVKLTLPSRSEKILVYRQTNAPCKIKYEIVKVEEPMLDRNQVYQAQNNSPFVKMY
jgi:hypothetical protein